MGKNKALLPYPGVGMTSSNSLSFITQLTAVLLATCEEVVLVAHDHEQLSEYVPYITEHVLCVTDRGDQAVDGSCEVRRGQGNVDMSSQRGPMVGLYSGLSAMHSSHAFVVAVDMPFVTREMVMFLQGQVGDEQIVLPVVDGAPQVLCAIYAASILPIVVKKLREGERGPRALLRSVEVKIVDEDMLRGVEPELHSFRNINTPGDFERVRWK